MKKILFAAMAILIGSAVTAQQPDAIYKLIRYEWTLNADGSSDYHYRHEVQILRTRSLIAYADKGETFVVYNPDLEDLTVNEVYTIQKDGTRVNMPQNAFVYQLPSECADCGRFNHMRELAMVHTGMELGCTIVVDYTIHRRYNFIHENIPLKRDCPVDKLEAIVNYNNDIIVNYNITGNQYLPESVTRSESINTDNMGRILRYTFSNMPQAPREPYMPADIIPTLHIFNGTPQFTVADDGKDFSDAEDIVGKMTDKGTIKETITKIRNHVVDNIHLNDIAPCHLGYAVASPAETWRTGCGTAADKAALLSAILLHEGYQAHVTGDNNDLVGVLIDTLEYRFDVRSKAPAQLYGEAHDEVSTGNFTTTADAELDTLADGFFRLSFAGISGEPTVSARSLALTRNTPLQGNACDLTSIETYTLPKGMNLVGGNVSDKLSFDGIGSMLVSVKQSGKTLKVERKLKIEKSIIPVEDYANYRKLLATWQSHNGAMLRIK
jgi:hypothetical protein